MVGSDGQRRFGRDLFDDSHQVVHLAASIPASARRNNSELRLMMIFPTRRFPIAKHAALCAAMLGMAALAASAEHTRYWVQSSYDDFTKGSPNGVALRSDGKLMLAPQFNPMADPGMAFLWAIRADAKGN